MGSDFSLAGRGVVTYTRPQSRHGASRTNAEALPRRQAGPPWGRSVLGFDCVNAVMHEDLPLLQRVLSPAWKTPALVRTRFDFALREASIVARFSDRDEDRARTVSRFTASGWSVRITAAEFRISPRGDFEERGSEVDTEHGRSGQPEIGPTQNWAIRNRAMKNLWPWGTYEVQSASQ